MLVRGFGTLVCALGFMSTCAGAQEVTLAGHVRVVNASHNAESKYAENVVVWLTPANGPPAAKPVAKQPLVLIQHNKIFDPHLLVVPVGSVVQFPNRDPFFHNVFSLFEGKRFDLGLYEAGTTRNVSFDRPGISYIFCNIHAEMSAVVVAVDTPYYGISNRKGEVVIRNVPVGRYTMKTWSETALPGTLSTMTKELRVSPNSSTLGVLEVEARGTVTAHQNKFGMDYEPPTPDSSTYEHP